MRRVDTRYTLDASDLETALLAQGYQENVFAELEGKRPEKDKVRANCPFCGDTERQFVYWTSKPTWACGHLNRCSRRGNWYTYLRETGRVRDYPEYVRLLAGAAGLEISAIDEEQYQERLRKASLFEAAQAHFKEQLHARAGAEVYQYLLGRGYSPEDVEAMALGAYVDKEKLKAHLEAQGFSPSEVEASGLVHTTGLAEYNTLAIPVPGSTGQLIGITFRTLLSTAELSTLNERLKAQGSRPISKYVNTRGYHAKEGLTGLSRAIHSRRKILVEGYLDGHFVNLKAEQAGLSEPIVALGTCRISEEQIKSLELTRTEEVVLALDAEDAAGLKGTIEAVEKLREVPGLKIYIAPLSDYAEAPGQKVDPDALVCSRGIEAFIECCSRAKSWSRWTAERLLGEAEETEELASDLGRDRLFHRLAEVYETISNRGERESFLEPLEALTEDARGLLEDSVESVRAERQAQEQRARAETLVRSLTEAKDGGEFGKVEELLSRSLEGFREARTRPPEPYLTADLEQDVLSMREGLKTGFSRLDAVIGIPPGALTIVAGRPAQGKTTLQLNLLLNMLEEYPDRSFFFFSYEEARKALAIKLLIRLAGETITEDTNYGAYMNYLKEKRGSSERIEQAWRKLDVWTATGRLWLLDTPYRAAELCQTIRYLHERYDTGAVFVDYLQKIPGDRGSYSTRQAELQDVMEQLRQTAVQLDTPLILGAQFGRYDKRSGESRAVRLDNLREAGDIENDSHLVLGLHCVDIEIAQEQEGQDRTLPASVDMKLKVLKNRNGPKPSTVLDFNRPILTIREKDEAGAANNGLW